MTGVFVFTLLRSQFRSARLRQLAVRSLLCSLVAVVTTCTNVIILAVVEMEAGFACLSQCIADSTSARMSLTPRAGPDPQSVSTCSSVRSVRLYQA
jgi:hypothetical protein